MRVPCLGVVVSALVGGATLGGCAGDGSRVTQSVGPVPATAQRGIAPGGASTGRQARSGVRRMLSVPGCSDVGSGSFIGGGASNVAGGIYSFVGAGGSNQACDALSAIVGGRQNAVSSGETSVGFIGGGEYNTLTTDPLDSAILGGGYNGVSNEYSTVVGGYDNAVFAAYSLIGGGKYNTLYGTAEYAAIASGYSNAVAAESSLIGSGNANTISSVASFSAIASGAANSLSGEYGFIGAGSTNTLSAEYGVVVGGVNNTVSGEGAYIAAGGYNTASAEGAVVDGGFAQTASGTFSTIPGGYRNTASATYSFAAGAFGTAAHEGAFVWSDGSNGSTVLTSSHAYQFLARASGGFTLYTNAAATVGAQLAAGSGTWASLSDRNAKTNIAPLNDDSVLAKLDALPISRWSYKTEHGVRHVGPMAQDFYAAFKVGEDDKHITSIDEDGVALAAIKALHAENGGLHADNQTLHAENATLRRRLATDEAHVRQVDAELAHIVAVLGK